MKITFHGAAQNVTGSKHLIETGDGFRLLLDCGFHQGHRKEAGRLNRNLPMDAKSIGAVILSHAHLDHCGLLPLLVKKGFTGSIYATPATIDVAEAMLEDATHIQESDTEYLNRHLRKNQNPIEPLYNWDDCVQTMKQFKPAQYAHLGGSWTALSDSVRFKMYDAGHILGSAVIVVEITEKGQKRTLAFTGDLGRRNAPILRDPDPIAENVDILLSEATYGDRLHEPPAETEKIVRQIIERAIKHQSKIIVPAFALGRTQELIYLLHQLFHVKGFPKIPVYLDSPLATRVTGIFQKHRNVFDNQTWKDFDPEKDLPLMFEGLIYARTTEESKRLNEMQGPFMVISASGMMEAGRVLHHLKNSITNPNNTILITGYQAENTLGRRIQDGVSPVRIFNQTYDVKARVETAHALSAHADQAELLEYVGTAKGLSKLFLVHGEARAMETFTGLVSAKFPGISVASPGRGESVEL
ncbi:MAG: MBL fold metallo-hydrolase [Parcubacteria group bacterium]|nr:MBL fold metallo-hydrolase [Parcubacteria group bacterium]MBI2636923.1 MBL fold metallo-hydrolase [Parcubacteria group bacterium]